MTAPDDVQERVARLYGWMRGGGADATDIQQMCAIVCAAEDANDLAELAAARPDAFNDLWLTVESVRALGGGWS